MNLLRSAALALAGALSIASTVSMAADRYTIGTNPQGSLYFTIGGGIAAALQKSMGKKVTVQPFTGSSVYIPLVDAGEVTMGLNSGLDLGGWYNGDNGKALTNMRVLTRVWPLTVGYAVRADLGITKVSELAGKRVVTDFSALKAMGRLNKTMLKLSGVDASEVTNITTAGLGSGMSELTENAIDATSIAVGIPLTKQAHAAIPGGIRYLSLDGPDATDEMAEKLYPGLYLYVVKPAKRLPEVTEPVTVVRYDVFISVSADLPNEDATALLSALYDSLPQLKKDYRPLGAASQAKMALPTNTIPYHPASIAFFKSKGMWTEDNDTREATYAK